MLVVGLAVGFFIGFGVTNKDLDVDWKAITPICAALIASGVALYISNRWKNQKGAEVIADEAKQNIKDILELIKVAYEMVSNNCTADQSYENFKIFVKLHERIVRSSLYINDCTDVDGFKPKMEEFFEHCIKVQLTGRDFKPKENNPEFKSNLKDVINYLGSTGINMVNILIPYSIYQKKFIFKNKS